MNDFLLEDIKYLKEIADTLHLEDKKIAVTGATGMIGRVLVNFLKTITDESNIFVSGKDDDDVNSVFLKTNLIKFNLKKIDELKDKNIDYLIHLASPTNSVYLSQNPVETIDFIYSSTKNLLDFVTENNIKMIYVSSMEVYGEVFNESKRIEDELGYLPLTNTRSSYPESKRLCELLCYSYYKEKGTCVVIARLAQTFGAGTPQNDPRIFGYIGRCVLNNDNIVLKTKGNSFGNYCYIADTISAFLYMMKYGKNGETYNVVGDNRMKIYDMAQLVVSEIAHNNIKVIVNEEKNSNVFAKDTMLNMSSDKLRGLGWKPHFNLLSMFSRMLGSWENYNEKN